MKLAPLKGMPIVAYHNSWPYFARRFRLDVVDFIEPRPGVAPSPAHLARLISDGRNLQVRAILHAELDALPERFRTPLVLCYLEGLTQDEAARRLGWTAATVKGRLQRGRARLRP